MAHLGKRKEPSKLVIRGATHDEHIMAEREIRWAGWIDECVSMHEAFIEGLLMLMPSQEGKDV